MTNFTLTPEPTPRERRVWTPQAGRLAQRVGKNFQDWCQKSAGVHKSIVTLAFLPPLGAKYIFDPKTRTRKVITTKIPVDAMGCFCADGVALHFDCKSTESATSFDVSTMVFAKEHQYHHLCKIRNANGVGGYVIEARAIGEYLFLDCGSILTTSAIPWAKSGKLNSCFISLGSMSGAVDFAKLRQAYFPEKKPLTEPDLAEMEARGHPAKGAA